MAKHKTTTSIFQEPKKAGAKARITDDFYIPTALTAAQLRQIRETYRRTLRERLEENRQILNVLDDRNRDPNWPDATLGRVYLYKPQKDGSWEHVDITDNVIEAVLWLDESARWYLQALKTAFEMVEQAAKDGEP